MIEDKDRELVQRARIGDRNALTILTEKYSERICQVIMRMINDSARAEELTYEAFIRAFNNLKSFRGDAKFSSWLYRIAINLALGERAKKKIEHVSLDALGTMPCSPATHPDYVYQNLFYSQVIEESLAQLPQKYALPLKLFYLKGVGYVEIAEIMKIPIGTVKTFLHRGKRALREIIGDKYSKEELI